MMTMDELCEIIDLQDEIRKKVMEFYRNFDYDKVLLLLDKLLHRETRKSGRLELKEALGEDPYGIKILSCMLYCAVRSYKQYELLNISKDIFITTMKCFTRFINETYEMTGVYAFDRDWWTARQISLQLFRIGELEYELDLIDGRNVINMHIPSDADFSESKCSDSLKNAFKFMKKYFPDFAACDYVCNSWLLSPSLKKLLPKHSNIMKFQSRFTIIKVNEEDTEFMEWVFRKRLCKIEELPEKTTLQKNMKRFLLDGGKIGDAFGILNGRI